MSCPGRSQISHASPSEGLETETPAAALLDVFGTCICIPSPIVPVSDPLMVLVLLDDEWCLRKSGARTGSSELEVLDFEGLFLESFCFNRSISRSNSSYTTGEQMRIEPRTMRCLLTSR